MIFVTGDIHGAYDIEKLSYENWPESRLLTRDDYLIILGDFGLPFLTSDTTDEKLTSSDIISARKNYLICIKWLSQCPYTILWVDGNHDNHPYWYQQEVKQWHGGEVNFHPLADNVIHLKRGEYYEIDGNTFWCMGGASSVDRNHRIDGFTWWKEELPSISEMNHGMDVLYSHNNRVDYILTHTMPSSLVVPLFKYSFNQNDPLEKYFDEVFKTVDFQYWLCGHFHMDIKCDTFNLAVLYNSIMPLSEFRKE